jgi:hypothetical protein
MLQAVVHRIGLGLLLTTSSQAPSLPLVSALHEPRTALIETLTTLKGSSLNGSMVLLRQAYTLGSFT